MSVKKISEKKNSIDNVKLKRVWHHYWLKMRERRFWLFVTLSAYGAAGILANVVTPLWYKELVDFLNLGEVSEVWRVFAWIVGTILLYQLFFRLGDYAIVRFQTDVMEKLENHCFTRLLKHSAAFFADNFVGSLVAKSSRFVRGFENMGDIVVFQFWMTGLQTVLAIFTLLWINLTVGLIFLVWLIVYAGVVFWFLRRSVKLDTEAAKQNSVVTGRFSDVMSNIINVKVFSAARREEKLFSDAVNKQIRALRRAWFFANWQWLAQAVLWTILEVGGMGAALHLWSRGELSVGTIVLIQIFIGKLFSGLWGISRSLKQFVRTLSDAKEMVEILDLPLEVEDGAASVSLPQQVKGEIDFRNVHFAYGKDNKRVFHNFNLHIPAGQSVGLVGRSGAGKTTLVKLLLRFADLQDGEILIDGHNIACWSQDDLRSLISYVPQEPILFHRSLYDNIAYARPEASEEEVYSAAAKAHAHEFIINLPEGYETLVGERGIKLSGGQRQRIALARAFLENAPILLLDEATSALDSVSEKLIQESLAELIKNKTTIVVAHRLSTVQKLDRIIVLENGHIVEDGKHPELLSAKGRYRDFWEHQSGGFLP